MGWLAGVAVSGRYIYWQTGQPEGWIGRANFDGTEVRRRLINVTRKSGRPFSGGIAADSLGEGGADLPGTRCTALDRGTHTAQSIRFVQLPARW
jgi:hypothetical protein